MSTASEGGLLGHVRPHWRRASLCQPYGPEAHLPSTQGANPMHPLPPALLPRSRAALNAPDAADASAVMEALRRRISCFVALLAVGTGEVQSSLSRVVLSRLDNDNDSDGSGSDARAAGAAARASGSGALPGGGAAPSHQHFEWASLQLNLGAKQVVGGAQWPRPVCLCLMSCSSCIPAAPLLAFPPGRPPRPAGHRSGALGPAGAPPGFVSNCAAHAQPARRGPSPAVPRAGPL